jgi:hypothetical protein
VSTTTVTTTTAMEATTTAHVTVDGTAGETASGRARSAIATTIWYWTTNITGTAVTITRVSVVAAAIAIHAVVAVSVTVTVVPGSRADKDAAGKPRRAIVSVRRAGIRIVAVVAIGADRSRIPIAVTAVNRSADTNADRNLGMRIRRCGNQQNTE